MVIAGTATCRGSSWPCRAHSRYWRYWRDRCSRCARPPFTFRGTCSSSTTYTIGDAVFESGTSYIAVVSNTAVDPATNVSGSGGIWAVLARAGSSSTVSVGTTTTGASGTSAVVTN